MHRLTLHCLRHPKLTVLVILAVTALLTVGALRVRTEFGYRVLIGDDHPSIQTLDRFIQQFGGGAPITIAWECGDGHPCENVFDPASLEMAESLRRKLEVLEFVSRIDGPTNSVLLVPDETGFGIRRFIEGDEISSDREELATHALADPLWVGTLISPDGLVGAMHLQASDTETETERRLVADVQGALGQFEELGFEFYLVGDSVATIVAGVSLSKSMERLIPILVVAIAAVILMLTGSPRQTLAAMLTMGLALLWSFGAMGWLGWPQDGILEVLPPLILTVGVCDAIHFLSVLKCPEAGQPRERAIYQAARDVAPGCTLTTLTTAGAFLSFATSNLQTFVRFGVISAFSVVVCLVLTFSLLPLLCRWLSIDIPPRGRVSVRWERALGAVMETTRRRSWPILGVTTILLTVCGLSWFTSLRVDNDWLESLGEHSEVTRWVRFVEERLRNSEFLEVELVSPRSGDSLGGGGDIAVVSDLEARLETVAGLGKATSIVDYVERLNRLMHDDSPDFERIPDDPRQTAELLELLTIGDASLLDPWMTPDRVRFRISVESPLRWFSAYQAILHDSRAVLDEHLPPGWTATQSGVMTINRDWVRDIQATQVRSFPTAFAIVLLMVSLFLGSFRLGLVAMVPALVAVVVTLGAMGWMEMSLDVGRAMIAAVVIGIAVDDSIHLLSKYREYAREGQRPRDAVQHAVGHVGRAVVTTSLALAIGFLTLTFSAWQTISSFGFFVALAILGALIATLFVVPALVYRLDSSDETEADRGSGSRVLGELARPSRRTLLTLVALGPSLLALGIAASSLSNRAPARETDCWLLPTARVALIPGPRCPLSAHAEIAQLQWEGRKPLRISDQGMLRAALEEAPDSVQVTTDRGVDAEWAFLGVHDLTRDVRLRRLGVAATAILFLLWLPVVLVRRSSAPAAIPLTFFYSGLSVVTIAVVAARDSMWLNRAALLVTTLGPAILVHLSFTFPRVRRFASDAQGLLAFPYAACAVFFPVALWAMEKRPLLWPSVVYLLIGLSLAAWVILVLSCFFAMRESRSPLEKARARLLVWSALGLFVIAVPVTTGIASGAMANLALYLAFSVAVIPLPIGLAISRYNLFDLRQDARLWAARLVFFSLAAGFVTLLVGGVGVARDLLRPADLPVVFGLALLGVLALEPLRGPVLGWMEGLFVPHVERLRAQQARYAGQMRELRAEEEVASLLSRALSEALEARFGAVLLAAPGGWHLTSHFGAPPSRLPGLFQLAEAGRACLAGKSLFQIADPVEAGRNPHAVRLFEAGVEVVASLSCAGEELGLVLIGRRTGEQVPEPYMGTELDLVSVAVSHASTALRNARIAASLLAAERAVSTGRTALALAHGVSKDIGLIRTLARRLAVRSSAGRREQRDLALVEDLARELEASVRGFVREATRDATAGTLSLGEAVERAVRVAARSHGMGRIRRAVGTDLQTLPVDVGVERVLANLLDNALLASPSEEEVVLSARLGEDELALEVRDCGCGMSESERRNAFSLGFTTRREQGGFGVGLAVSRDLAEGLGGSVRLDPNPRGGTIATMRVPLTGA